MEYTNFLLNQYKNIINKQNEQILNLISELKTFKDKEEKRKKKDRDRMVRFRNRKDQHRPLSQQQQQQQQLTQLNSTANLYRDLSIVAYLHNNIASNLAYLI